MTTILLADDSRLVRNSFKRYLQELAVPNMTVMEAANGSETLDLFSGKPEILVLDLIMPEPDGTQVLSMIQDTPHDCFIAVLSSNFQKPVKERVLRLGARLFVEKPLSVEKVRHILEEYSRYRQQESS